MEKENLKSVYSKRFRYSNEKPEMKASEAIFLVLATLVEIGYPLYFWLSDYKMRFPYNIIFMLGTILAFFLIFCYTSQRIKIYNIILQTRLNN